MLIAGCVWAHAPRWVRFAVADPKDIRVHPVRSVHSAYGFCLFRLDRGVQVPNQTVEYE
jgi:hypothetical protein